MANEFAFDDRFIEFWNFENNLNGGKASANLSSVGTPAYSATEFIEGAYSLNSENGHGYLANASLPTGFPLKSGDSAKIGMWFAWIWPNGQYVYPMGMRGATAANNTLGIYLASMCAFNVDWYYASGTYERISCGFALAPYYWNFVALGFDGVTKAIKIRWWREDTGVTTNYTKTPTATLYLSSTAYWNIGGRYESGVNFPGFIDQVAVADEWLTDAEIDDIRQQKHDEAKGTPMIVHVSMTSPSAENKEGARAWNIM